MRIYLDKGEVSILENVDIKKLMQMLGKVNPKDLEYSIKKANEIMNSKDKDKIIEDLKKNLH